jgi:hypothetical protein
MKIPVPSDIFGLLHTEYGFWLRATELMGNSPEIEIPVSCNLKNQMFKIYQATNMANTKPENKCLLQKESSSNNKKIHNNIPKASQIKSTVSSQATTAFSSRALTAAPSQPSTSSHGASSCATVEESNNNDDEPGYVGDSLDADGDIIMELSLDEELEDDESELSKVANI